MLLEIAMFSSLLSNIFSGGHESNGIRPVGLQDREVTVNGTSYNYQVYIPGSVANQTNPPVMLFLHGINQRGRGGYLPKSGVSHQIMRGYLDRVPAIIVLPQCDTGKWWSEDDMDQLAIGALDQTTREFEADENRTYLIGVSMGGYGAWSLGARHPSKFAAIVPICGGSPLKTEDRHTAIAQKIGRTPLWVFHGAEDKIVPVSESREMVEAVKKAGGNVRYSEYEGVGHNVWFKAASEPGLIPWIMSQGLS
jgi:predicted peptidase